MKVGFNARLLLEPTLRGWSRYTVNLLVELAALDVQLVLYSDRAIHPIHLQRLPKSSYQIRVAPVMRYIQWEQRWLPQQCAIDAIDILHCPMNFGLPALSHCPQVLTLHDVIDQAYYCCQLSWRQRLSFASLQSQFYHWVAYTRSTHIITVSEFSRQDLIRHLKVPAAKVSVIYEAADAQFRPTHSEAVRSRYQLQSPYVFYVGGLEQRKNIPFLVKAFAEANLEEVELVLAGGRVEEQRQIALLAESLGVADQVRCLGWVEDGDLPALYSGALCFVYASEYEGFGLQLCEAMATECPILAADATCLPEILGEGGDLFSLQGTQDLANRLRYISANPDYRSQLKRQARVRSRQFSWRQTAIETLKVYEQLLPIHKQTQQVSVVHPTNSVS